MVKTYALDAAQKSANAVFTAMTRMGWGAGYRWMLSVPGRTTGVMRSTPVDVMDVDGHRWLVAPYGETNWVRNVRAHPRINLSRGSQSETLVAIPAVGDEVLPVVRQYVRSVPVTSAYWGVTAESSDAEIRADVVSHPVFRLHPA